MAVQSARNDHGAANRTAVDSAMAIGEPVKRIVFFIIVWMVIAVIDGESKAPECGARGADSGTCQQRESESRVQSRDRRIVTGSRRAVVRTSAHPAAMHLSANGLFPLPS